MDRSTKQFVFVKPEDDTDVSDEMNSAFKLCQRVDFAKWMDAEELENIEDLSDQVYVFQSFSGKAFKKLKDMKTRIIGPKCVLYCVKNEESLQFPEPIRPVFNYAMRDLVVCCTNIAREVRVDVHNKVMLMGGNVCRQLTTAVTHLIALQVSSQKYKAACNWNKPVMLPAWVLQCWEDSLKGEVHADNSSYLKDFRCPIFAGVCVTVSQVGNVMRKEIQELVTKNGGSYNGSLTVDTTTHVVLLEATGDKYEVAKKKNIPCVTTRWVYDSVEKGYCVDENLYQLTKSGEANRQNASTPKSDNKGQPLSMPDVSHIINNISCAVVNETIMTRDFSVAFSVTNFANNPVCETTAGKDELNQLDVTKINSSVPFLDGCKIFINGFSPSEMDKVRKLLNAGGATRFSQMNDTVTHVVLGGSADGFKVTTPDGAGPHIVNAGWLIQSFKEGRPVDETPYMLKSSDSSSGAVTIPTANNEVATTNSTEGRTVPLDFNANDGADGDNHDDMAEDDTSLNYVDIFEDLTFEIFGFDEQDRKSLTDMIETNGGVVKQNENDSVVYAVGPPMILPHSPTRCEFIVTNFWLQHCVEEKTLFDAATHPLFFPIDIDVDAKPLAGCVFSISQYSGAERDCISHISEILGARCQEFFVRRDNTKLGQLANTHLIVREADGSKYNGALKWGRPAVNMNWLVQCAKTSSKVDISPFVVGDAIGLIQTKPVTKRILDLNKSEASRRVNSPAATTSGTPGIYSSSASNGAAFQTPIKSGGTPLASTSTSTIERMIKDDNIEEIRQRYRNNYNTPNAAGTNLVESIRKDDSSPMANSSTDSPSFSSANRDPKSFRINIRDAMASLDTPEANVGQPKEIPIDQLYEMQIKKNLIYDIENNRSIVPGRKVEDILGDDSERICPLTGLVIVVSSKLSSQQSELNRIAELLGAKVRWKYDKLCTHLVHQGKPMDSNKEFRAAKSDGKFIVSPDWLRACQETLSKVDEKSYPCTQNSNRMLTITTETLKQRTPSQSNQISQKANTTRSNSKTASDPAKKLVFTEDSEVGDQKMEMAEQQMDEILAAAKLHKKKRSEQDVVCKSLHNDDFVKPLPRSPLNENKESEKDDATSSITWDDPTSRKERERMAFLLAKDSQQSAPATTRESDSPEIENENGFMIKSLQCGQEVTAVDTSESEEEEEPKAKPIIVFSGSTEQIRQSTAKEFQKLGGTVLSTSDTSCSHTHLIVPKPSRSLKFLSSLASGKWILKHSYINECMEQQRFVEEEDHEWGNPNINDSSNLSDEQKLASAAYSWRVTLENIRKGLPKSLHSGVGAFQQWRVIIYSSQPRIDSFRILLEGGGAKIMRSEPPFTNAHGATHCFLELAKAPSTNVDFESLVANEVKCLMPEYIASYLVNRDDVDEFKFTVREAQEIILRQGPNKSKRKSDDDSDEKSKKCRSRDS